MTTFSKIAKDGGKSPRPKPKPVAATPAVPASTETEKKKTSKYRDIDEPWAT